MLIAFIYILLLCKLQVFSSSLSVEIIIQFCDFLREKRWLITLKPQSNLNNPLAFSRKFSKILLENDLPVPKSPIVVMIAKGLSSASGILWGKTRHSPSTWSRSFIRLSDIVLNYPDTVLYLQHFRIYFKAKSFRRCLSSAIFCTNYQKHFSQKCQKCLF